MHRTPLCRAFHHASVACCRESMQRPTLLEEMRCLWGSDPDLRKECTLPAQWAVPTSSPLGACTASRLWDQQTLLGLSPTPNYHPPPPPLSCLFFEQTETGWFFTGPRASERLRERVKALIGGGPMHAEEVHVVMGRTLKVGRLPVCRQRD